MRAFAPRTRQSATFTRKLPSTASSRPSRRRPTRGRDHRRHLYGPGRSSLDGVHRRVLRTGRPFRHQACSRICSVQSGAELGAGVPHRAECGAHGDLLNIDPDLIVFAQLCDAAREKPDGIDLPTEDRTAIPWRRGVAAICVSRFPVGRYRVLGRDAAQQSGRYHARRTRLTCR